MNEVVEPVSRLVDRYRPSDAGINLNIGPALKAILPASFQGAVLGSLLSAAGAVVLSPVIAGDMLWEAGPAGMVMMLCGWVFVGTLAGTLFSTFYIAAVGLPLALVLREHIEGRAAIVVVLVVSAIMGLVAMRYLGASGWEDWPLFAFGLTYAIPAGIAYRRELLLERFITAYA